MPLRPSLPASVFSFIQELGRNPDALPSVGEFSHFLKISAVDGIYSVTLMETLAFALGRHPLSCIQWESQGRSTRANERGLEGCRAVLMDLGIISALFGSNGFQYIASQIPGFAG